MHIFILDFFVKTVGYFNKNDKTIWSYPFFLTRKNIVHVKLQPCMQALVTSRLRWQLKYLFWFYTWLAISAVVSCTRAWKLFSDAAIRPWEMHVLYNPDGIVKYSVIHHLRLINSAQLCNKKFQSICYSDWVCTAVMSNDVMKDLRGWYAI